MENKSRLTYLIPGGIFYLAIPLLYMIFGDFASRTILKEILSLATVGAFYLMLAQFYLSRLNTVTLKDHKFSKVVSLHKILGYVAILVLILHPFFIILPRYFEASLDLKDAFMLMITDFSSLGIVLGLISMVLMLLIGITAILRKKMKLKYTTWRTMHAFLSLAFIITATWHSVDLGRHMDAFLSLYTIVMASIGIVLLLKLYFFSTKKEEK
jgi:predicted ferric reductase